MISLPLRIGVLAVIPFAALAQPPAITQEGVRNLASQMPPSLPGGALSPGALFSVHGLRLGTGTGTRVVFRQGGAEREAELIKVSAEYLEARVPLTTTPPTAELVVVRDGQSSRPFPLRIAAGAAGIFSENGKGWGPGGQQAHPGDRGFVAGTGLHGLDTAEVWVGGKRASGVSVGPGTGKAGVDEIHFTLAAETPLGCYVPVLIKTASGVSNAVTIPVAVQGQPCPEAARQVPDALLLFARLIMRARLADGAAVNFTQDIGAALFSGASETPLLTGWKELPPVRTCTSYSGNWISDSTSGGITEYLFQSGGAGRDAGPTIQIAGPKGAGPLQPRRGNPGFYTAELGGGLPFTRYPKPPFLTEGLLRFTGAGGADIGEFAVESRYTKPLQWRDAAKLDIIDRGRGALVRWSRVSSQQRVLLLAINVDQLTGGMGACLCVAPGEAGQFAIPPLMLANLPVSQPIPGIPMNYLFAGTLPVAPQEFRTRGVKNGVMVLTSLQGRTVTFR